MTGGAEEILKTAFCRFVYWKRIFHIKVVMVFIALENQVVRSGNSGVMSINVDNKHSSS